MDGSGQAPDAESLSVPFCVFVPGLKPKQSTHTTTTTLVNTKFKNSTAELTWTAIRYNPKFRSDEVKFDMVLKMSSSASSDTVMNEWDSLQRDLNLDKETGKQAWKAYQDIKQNYTLEVGKLFYL